MPSARRSSPLPHFPAAHVHTTEPSTDAAQVSLSVCESHVTALDGRTRSAEPRSKSHQRVVGVKTWMDGSWLSGIFPSVFEVVLLYPVKLNLLVTKASQIDDESKYFVGARRNAVRLVERMVVGQREDTSAGSHPGWARLCHHGTVWAFKTGHRRRLWL